MPDLIFRSSITLKTQYGGGSANYDVISAVSDSNGAAASITTAALPGDTVGITASATINGQSVTYELTNSAIGKYAINSTTGVVTVGLVALSAGTDTIVVRATASSGQRRTQNFTITVNNNGLSWVAPTQRVDSSSLVGLAGYNIFYGSASGRYDSVINVNNPNTLTYDISALPAGTYYFVVTAYDSQFYESAYSTEVAATL